MRKNPEYETLLCKQDDNMRKSSCERYFQGNHKKYEGLEQVRKAVEEMEGHVDVSEILTNIIKCFMRADINQEELEGWSELKEKISKFVSKGKPIKFLLIGYPWKSCNHQQKTLSDYPDLAEFLSLQHLREFVLEITKYYKPSACVEIASDSHAFKAILGRDKKAIIAYRKRLQEMIDYINQGREMIKILHCQEEIDEILHQEALKIKENVRKGNSGENIDDKEYVDFCAFIKKELGSQHILESNPERLAVLKEESQIFLDEFFAEIEVKKKKEASLLDKILFAIQKDFEKELQSLNLSFVDEFCPTNKITPASILENIQKQLKTAQRLILKDNDTEKKLAGLRKRVEKTREICLSFEEIKAVYLEPHFQAEISELFLELDESKEAFENVLHKYISKPFKEIKNALVLCHSNVESLKSSLSLAKRFDHSQRSKFNNLREKINSKKSQIFKSNLIDIAIMMEQSTKISSEIITGSCPEAIRLSASNKTKVNERISFQLLPCAEERIGSDKNICYQVSTPWHKTAWIKEVRPGFGVLSVVPLEDIDKFSSQNKQNKSRKSASSGKLSLKKSRGQASDDTSSALGDTHIVYQGSLKIPVLVSFLNNDPQKYNIRNQIYEDRQSYIQPDLEDYISQNLQVKSTPPLIPIIKDKLKKN